MDPYQWFYRYVRYRYAPNEWKAKLVAEYGLTIGAEVHRVISSMGGANSHKKGRPNPVVKKKPVVLVQGTLFTYHINPHKEESMI